MKYLMAVPSSMQGSDYVIATGRGVLYLGGFDGKTSEGRSSPSATVRSHDLRGRPLGEKILRFRSVVVDRKDR